MVQLNSYKFASFKEGDKTSYNNIYLFKVTNINTYFEHSFYLFLVFLFMTLSK